MENFINPILTIILIGIYWFNTKAQNTKIEAQSDIIKELREHLKFFDIQKIKEYVELRETEKDKLLEITKQAVEKEFELKLMTLPKQSNLMTVETKNSKKTNDIDDDYLVEAYVYIATNLIWLPDNELEKILEKDFPTSKELVRKVISNSQEQIRIRTGISDLHEIKSLMEHK